MNTLNQISKLLDDACWTVEEYEKHMKEQYSRNHDLRGRVNGKNCPQLLKDLRAIVNDYVCPKWYRKHNVIKRRVLKQLRQLTRHGKGMHCVAYDRHGFWYFNADIRHFGMGSTTEGVCYPGYEFRERGNLALLYLLVDEHYQ